jgi:GT2 family glycosyltransferase
MEDRISVVVITHERVDELLHTLAMLTALAERPRIVVVDNGSSDGTMAAVRRHYPGVSLIALPRNLGTDARNVGVRYCSTPYVALCDDDAWWTSGSLATAVRLLDRYPLVAVMTAQVLVGLGELEDPTCRTMASSPLPPDVAVPGMPVLGFLAGACVLRRSAFLSVGGFEARYLIGGEEELVAMDLAARGWRMVYVPELTVHHHPSSRRDPNIRRRLMIRNSLWSAWLRRPAMHAIIRSIRITAMAPSFGTAVCAWLGALTGLPWVLPRRRVVPVEVQHQLRTLDTAGREAVP